MIKSLLKLSIALLSFMLIISAASAQGLKVGIVDMNRVFAEYYKTKEANHEELLVVRTNKRNCR